MFNQCKYIYFRFLSILLTLKSEIDLNTGEVLQKLTNACIEELQKIGSDVKTVDEAISEVIDNPHSSIANFINFQINK